MGDVPTKEEIAEAYQAALVAARAITRSAEKAADYVQSAYEAVLTTREWSRAKHTFKYHLVGATMSLISNDRKSARKKHDKEAHTGWHREEVGYSSASPEQKTIERAEEEGRQASADEELDALDASLEGNEPARRVLRCRREHGLAKARDIAEKLGMPVEVVYRANEAIKDHLKTMRKNGSPGPDEED